MDFFWKIDLGLDEHIEELNSLNFTTAKEEVIWSHELQEKRLKAQIQVWINLGAKDSMIKQKSRCVWLHNGEKN